MTDAETPCFAAPAGALFGGGPIARVHNDYSLASGYTRARMHLTDHVAAPDGLERACFSGALSWVKRAVAIEGEPEAPGALPRSLRHARCIISWKDPLDGATR